MVAVFASYGPLTVSVNGGASFTVGAGSRPPGFQPGGITSGTPPEYGWMPIGPNIIGIGSNSITVTPQVPGFEIPPKTFDVVLPPNTSVVGDTLQLYLMLDWTYNSITWVLTISGQIVSIGNSAHGQLPWPPAPSA